MLTRIIRSILRTLKHWFTGPPPLDTDDDVTGAFLMLFQAHGLPCQLYDGWIEADCLAAQAHVLVHSATPGSWSVQLDLVVLTPARDEIVESCGGFGESRRQAIGDAIQNFCNGSFHVIFSALSGQPCSHCEVEEWDFGGTVRLVFISPMVSRTNQADHISADWFLEMARQVRSRTLSSSRHWIRFYHWESPHTPIVNEVLLDGEDWPDMRECLASCSWPATNGFYSARVFLIVDAVDPTA